MDTMHVNQSMKVRNLRQIWALKVHKFTSFQTCAKFLTSGKFKGDEKYIVTPTTEPPNLNMSRRMTKLIRVFAVHPMGS